MNSNANFVKAEDEWVGEYPSGWTIKRADFVISSHREQISPEDMEGQIVYHYSIPVIQKTGAGAIEEGDDLDSGKLVIDRPQVLVSKLNPRKGTVCLVDQSEDTLTIASTEFVPLIPKNANLQYIFYVWKSEKIMKRLSSFVQSVTKSHQRCQPSDILKINWAWPDLDTQEAIANFLDEKTAHIDALIEKKRKLLEFLVENRAAIITNAVTKGINPDAPMKDSGIDWLGQIPEHWDCVKIKHFTHKVGSGVTPSGGAENYPDEGVLFIRSQNVHFDGLRLDDVAFIYEKTHDAMSKTAVKYNDVLLNITGASIGRCCLFNVVKTPANVNQHVCILRPKEALVSDWLFYVLSSEVGQNQIWLSQNGSSREGLNFADLKTFFIPLPPKNEQLEIRDRIIEQIDQVSELELKVGKVIQHLTEYRSALITNAVTGKIKVA